MTDRSFTEPYEEIIAALEDRIRSGVDRARFTFEGVEGAYVLSGPVYEITLVRGLKNGEQRVFLPDRDFRFADNLIVWLDPENAPDPGSRFEVRYVYSESPAGLTDFNPGSVVGTLVRAVAREMTLVYDQMDEAYRRAFIDEATGVALDSVVALLGVVRNPAQKATGRVTFLRRRKTDTPVNIPKDETRVADEGGRTFVTTEDGQILDQMDELGTQSNGVLRTTNRIGELIGVWRRGEDPDTAPKLDTEEPPVSGEDERTVTLASGVRPEGQLLIRYRPKSVTVAIEAVEPGPDGNVNAETITIMPTPPSGIDGVVNEEPTTDGQLPEPDDGLRERAKHALERAGNATLNAIRFAVLDVDGVEAVEIVDHSVDDTVLLGEVRVRYSGGDRAEVERAVDGARAAGIFAQLDEIERLLISGSFYLIPEPDAPPAATIQFLSAVVEAINALSIGTPLSVRRLNALVYDVTGLADVAEAQLDHDREDSEDQKVTDPLLVEPRELVRPDETRLEAVLVSALRAVRTSDNAPNELDVQLVDPGGNPIEWRNFTIDLAVTLRARFAEATTRPPVRIGSLTKTVEFSGTSTATLEITPQDVRDLEPGPTDEHLTEGVEVTVGAAAYPGILGAEGATIDLPDEE